eukprot:2511354-Rhodomonas_salina.1
MVVYSICEYCTSHSAGAWLCTGHCIALWRVPVPNIAWRILFSRSSEQARIAHSTNHTISGPDAGCGESRLSRDNSWRIPQVCTR